MEKPLPQQLKGVFFPIFSLMQEFDQGTARSHLIFPHPTNFEPYAA